MKSIHPWRRAAPTVACMAMLVAACAPSAKQPRFFANDGGTDSRVAADTAVPPAPECGNSYCRTGETCESCSADCCCATSDACGATGCMKGGRCCAVPQPFVGKQYGGMTYTNWTFPVERLDAITVRTCFENDPGDATGIYFQTYDGSIDGGGAYFGLQVGNLAGRLAIFSRFGTIDPGDIRVAPDGLSEIGTYEGPFVSVRHVYPFGVGCHDVRVRRADADGARDWFEMHVSPAESGQWTYVGAIRFPRANAAVPAAHTSGGGSWTEFFTPTDNALTLPYVHVTFAATANAGIAPTHAVSNYNNNDGAPIPNANVWYDPGDKRVHHEFGATTPQCVAAGQLF